MGTAKSYVAKFCHILIESSCESDFCIPLADKVMVLNSLLRELLQSTLPAMKKQNNDSYYNLPDQ